MNARRICFYPALRGAFGFNRRKTNGNRFKRFAVRFRFRRCAELKLGSKVV
jgi:hypothetical protein